MSVDPWLFVALAFAFGGSFQAAPALVAGLSLLLLALLAGGLRKRVALFAGVALALSAERAEHARSRYDEERARVRDAIGAPARCAGQGRVVASPVSLGGTLKSQVVFSELDCEGRQISGPVQVRLYGGPEGLARGDRIFAIAQLAPVRIFRDMEAPGALSLAARQGATLSGSALSVLLETPVASLPGVIDRKRSVVRERIQQTFAPAAAPLARALVLGENDLSASDDEAFKKSGLSHLLAVSGTHLVFAVVSLVGALRAFLVRIPWLALRVDVMRVASAIGAVLALLYADFSGGSGSAWRAAWMLALAFIVRVFDRQPRPARIVGGTLIVGAAVDPLLCHDVSFLLSLAATGGLLVIGQPLVRRVQSVRMPALRYLVVSVVATVASMIPCAPLLAWLAPELTLAGIAANVIAAPMGEIVALPLCLVHTLCAKWPSLEAGIALVASGALLAVGWVAHLSASLTWLSHSVPSPTPWHYAVLVFGGGISWLALGPRKGRSAVLCASVASCVVALFLLEAGIERRSLHLGRLAVTTLDVGQGDGHLVEFPNGATMLVDAGGFVGSPVDPGARVIVPHLRGRRRTRLDVVVLSHPHPDHFNGLVSVVDKLEVKEFWDTGQGIQEGAGPIYRQLRESLTARGIRIRSPGELCQTPHVFGEAVLEVLAPCPHFVPGRDANDNSLVMRLTLGSRRVLFTGDAEAVQETELIERHGKALSSDLLKLGHHGSRTSTGQAFLSTVSPSLAFVSSGVRNRFGHPHPTVLARLARAGIPLIRTDRAGSVRWLTDGEHVDVYATTLSR